MISFCTRSLPARFSSPFLNRGCKGRNFFLICKTFFKFFWPFFLQDSRSQPPSFQTGLQMYDLFSFPPNFSDTFFTLFSLPEYGFIILNLRACGSYACEKIFGASPDILPWRGRSKPKCQTFIEKPLQRRRWTCGGGGKQKSDREKSQSLLKVVVPSGIEPLFKV